jgi:hypothetical protein
MFSSYRLSCTHPTRVALLVDGAVQVFAVAFDLDVDLVHPPDFAHRLLVPSERLFEQRHELDDPAVHTRMIDIEIPLSHHFLKGCASSTSTPHTSARKAGSRPVGSATQCLAYAVRRRLPWRFPCIAPSGSSSVSNHRSYRSGILRRSPRDVVRSYPALRDR